MHLIKGNIGAGILAFPYAFSKAGILVKIFLLFNQKNIFFLLIFFLSSSVRLDRFLDNGRDDTLLHASITSLSRLLSTSVRFVLNSTFELKNFLRRTSRQKCDFGDVMRYTLATCRWHFLHRYAKLGKFVEEKTKR